MLVKGREFFNGKTMKITYSKIRPSGNDTAVINKNVSSKNLRLKINQAIMAYDKSIEQVCFIDTTKQPYKFQMAGDELSGNSLRASVFVALKQKKGQCLHRV